MHFASNAAASHAVRVCHAVYRDKTTKNLAKAKKKNKLLHLLDVPCAEVPHRSPPEQARTDEREMIRKGASNAAFVHVNTSCCFQSDECMCACVSQQRQERQTLHEVQGIRKVLPWYEQELGPKARCGPSLVDPCHPCTHGKKSVSWSLTIVKSVCSRTCIKNFKTLAHIAYRRLA